MNCWNAIKNNNVVITNFEYLQKANKQKVAEIITRASYDLAVGINLDPEHKIDNQFEKYLHMVSEWLDMSTDRLDIFNKYRNEMMNRK